MNIQVSTATSVLDSEILCIGLKYTNRLDNLRADSAGLFTDYKIIIIDPTSIIGLSSGGGGVSYPDAFKIMAIRHGELIGFLSKGGVLVCLLAQIDTMHSGGSPPITNYNFICNSWGYSNMKLVTRKGRAYIAPAGKQSSFQPVIEKIDQTYVYVDSTTEVWDDKKVSLKCLAKNSEDKWVAFEAKYVEYRGKMVFLPRGGQINLPLIIQCARKEIDLVGLPKFKSEPWTLNYPFPDYLGYKQELEQKQDKLEKMVIELEEKKIIFEQLEDVRNALLNGQGKYLEEAVKWAFNELGIQLEEGPEGRDDLILKEKGKTILVCEVKGTKTSAEEKYASQLEKWKLRVFDEEKHDPKGLLIVNSWCDTDPIDRSKKGNDFPDQMLPFCQKRELCLLTTIQLFNMWCAFKRKEYEAGNNLLKQIKATNGLFSGFEDIKPNRIPTH